MITSLPAVPQISFRVKSPTPDQRRLILLWHGLIALSILVFSVVVNAMPGRVPGRAITIWNAEEVLFNTENSREGLFTFCRDLHGADDPATEGLPRNPVDKIFLYARNILQSGGGNDVTLRRFIRESHKHGITVEYIDGDADWISRSGSEAMQVLNDVVTFNGKGGADERFDGMLIDVKPEGWSRMFSIGTRPQVLALLKNMQSVINVTGGGMHLGIAVPRWYYNRIGHDALAELIGLVKLLVVDDYVDQETMLVESMKPVMALAGSSGVPIYAALNADRNINPSLSYYEEGWLSVERGIAALYAAFNTTPSFAGVLINDYQSYRDLRRSMHSLIGAHTWSVQNGRSLPAIEHDSVDVLVLDAVADTSKLPKKVAMQQLQRAGSANRRLFYTLPLASVLARDTPSSALRRATRLEILQRISRALEIGCNGILIDFTGVDSLAASVNDDDLSAAIVAVTDTVAYAMRDMRSHPTAAIVLRGAEANLSRMDSSQYGELVAWIDGQTIEIPGPLFFRERDAVIVRLVSTSTLPGNLSK